MQILQDWHLEFDVDAVLRAQGADSAILRTRSPRLVYLAERAIQMASPLLEPVVLLDRFPVAGLRHEKLLLESGAELSGRLIAEHLPQASEVVALLCTIGSKLEAHASQVMQQDMLMGLALDGAGSAAVEALANAACAHLEQDAHANGLESSIPLSPGMEGWPVEIGQPQIFKLLKGEEIGVQLNSSGMMIPMKSLSMVVGVGEHVMQAGTTCDYCRLRETCRYKDHYTKA